MSNIGCATDLKHALQVTSTAQLHNKIDLCIILIHPMQADHVATVLYAAHELNFLPDLLHCLFLYSISKMISNTEHERRAGCVTICNQSRRAQGLSSYETAAYKSRSSVQWSNYTLLSLPLTLGSSLTAAHCPVALCTTSWT